MDKEKLPEIKTKTASSIRVLKALFLLSIISLSLIGIIYFLLKDQWNTITNIFT